MLNQFTSSCSSSSIEKLKEQAALRIDLFTQSHALYEEAMKAFNKMMAQDAVPENKGQGIYPMKLVKVSQNIFEGALAYCSAANRLARDYNQFCQDPRFVKEYQIRVDYIEIMQEELVQAMSDLKEHLSGIPFYEEGLKNGEAKIESVIQKLSHTKEIMQIAIHKATSDASYAINISSDSSEVATKVDPKDKKPKTP